MSDSVSSKTKNLIINKEYRCPKCYLIPFINIFTNENKLFMSTKCINNHSYLKPFEEMKLMCESSLNSNIYCANCENKNVNYNWDCTAKVLLKNN